MEYISQLQHRIKWKTHQANLAVRSLVIIRNDNRPPFKCNLGRVTTLHPRVDNVVRVTSVITTSGVFKRGVLNLCPLFTDSIGDI